MKNYFKSVGIAAGVLLVAIIGVFALPVACSMLTNYFGWGEALGAFVGLFVECCLGLGLLINRSII